MRKVLEFLERLGKRRLLRPSSRRDRVARLWHRMIVGACPYLVTAIGQELIDPVHLGCKWQRLFGDRSRPYGNI